jgi:hypothetical protein
MAQPFDPVGLKSTGEAVRVAEPVGLGKGWQAQFSVSGNGVLVYESVNRVQQQLAEFDRTGVRVAIIGPPAVYLSMAISPNERRLALRRNAAWPNPGIDIWLTDLVNGATSRFTFNRIPPSSHPVWAPPGDRIIFSTNRRRESILYEKAAYAGQNEGMILKAERDIRPTDWSPAASWIIFQQYDPRTHWDLWALQYDGERKPIPFERTEFDEVSAVFSSDGKWVAFQSNESGRDEIYIKPFSPGQTGRPGRWQISTESGVEPKWRQDGKELFYIAPDRTLMAAAVTIAGSFESGTPHPLFPMLLSSAGSETVLGRYLTRREWTAIPDFERSRGSTSRARNGHSQLATRAASRAAVSRLRKMFRKRGAATCSG